MYTLRSPDPILSIRIHVCACLCVYMYACEIFERMYINEIPNAPVTDIGLPAEPRGFFW